MTLLGPEMGLDNSRLYTVAELAKLLVVGEKTVYRMVSRQEIAFVQLARGLRFTANDIQAFLVGHRVRAVNEHEYGSTKNRDEVVR